MSKYLFLTSVSVCIFLATSAGAQTGGVNPDLDDPNPNLGNPDPNLGDPNPQLDDPNPNLSGAQPTSGGTTTNPTMQPDNAQPFGNPNVGPDGAAGESSGAAPQTISGAAAVDNSWRMVRHNGRWWYWTPNNTWLYRRGNSWVAYQGRIDARQNVAQRNTFDQRRRAGYRGDAGFEAQTQGTIDPRFDGRTTLSGGATARGGVGSNFSDGTTNFDGDRPPLPTAAELQRFQAQQQSLNAPYGGTMGGARNQTAPLGGGATRSNAFGTAAGGLGSPGNPAAVPQSTPGSPGNPSAVPQSAPGNTGNPSTSGGASPAGGGTAPGTSGAGGTGGTTGGAGGAGTGGTGGTGGS